MDFLKNSPKWTRQPKQVQISGDKVEIITERGTDLWARTYYGFQNDNAPVFQMQLILEMEDNGNPQIMALRRPKRSRRPIPPGHSMDGYVKWCYFEFGITPLEKLIIPQNHIQKSISRCFGNEFRCSIRPGSSSIAGRMEH